MAAMMAPPAALLTSLPAIAPAVAPSTAPVAVLSIAMTDPLTSIISATAPVVTFFIIIPQL
ncbi:hypothetical protein BN133_3650 [Cronobacter dublinensis 582]|nr:hypothetical protein BN133_3650 [Cronobacter dublinensis 582]